MSTLANFEAVKVAAFIFLAWAANAREKERPGPDVCQNFQTFQKQAADDNMAFEIVIDKYFEEFEQSTQNASKHFTDIEKKIIQSGLPHLTTEGYNALDYHWNQHRPHKSAVTYDALAGHDSHFLQGTNPRNDCDLWRTICKGDGNSPENNFKRECFVRRSSAASNYI